MAIVEKIENIKFKIFLKEKSKKKHGDKDKDRVSIKKQKDSSNKKEN